MFTSYFKAKIARTSNAVAISQGVPNWYKGRRYMPLAPSWELIKLSKDQDVYTEIYQREYLDNLDPAKVYEDLGKDAVLLCWEAPGKFCHRRLAANWLEYNLHIVIPEWTDVFR